ncbi:MAG: PP2C family serine/threonine-protein phosphatase [Caldilineaceae bacterium]
MSWQLLSASVAGSSHLRTQLPCQDAHCLASLAGGEMLCAVADGLGSAALSDQGAQLAVQVALDSLTTTLQMGLPESETERETAMRSAFASARNSLQEKATAANQPLRDYATTLIVAVLSKGWLGVAHLGDGAVVAHFENEPLCTISPPMRGEYANETMPLTSPDALASVRYQARSGNMLGVSIFSDGLQNLCLDAATGEPYEPFFAPLFAQLAQPIEPESARQSLIDFLQSERVCKRSDDDKTLVLLRRCE